MQHRLALILPIYSLMFTASLFLSFCLRFDFNLGNTGFNWFIAALPFVLGVKFVVCILTREWNHAFRHATITDMLVTAASCGISAVILMSSYYLYSDQAFIVPRSVILIDALLSLMFISSFRVGCRIIWKKWNRGKSQQSAEAALIFGTDETSIGIWKMLMASNGQLGRFRIVGFIDNSPQKRRSLIGGQKVYSFKECEEQSKLAGIQHILVPTTTTGGVVRDLLQQCKQIEVEVHKIPTVEEIVKGRFRLAVRDLDIDDLLRRPPTKLGLEEIGESICGKTVLVTGGAGSIGSELCRQVLSFRPAKLIVYDHSEFGVFQLEQEFIKQKSPETKIIYNTASILDSDALEGVFSKHSPQIVFHAAAYKHVPLMQDNPYAAIRNNILGTKQLVDAAHRHQVERFVLISTDKAVRPTSVMGATKLMAEKYLQAMAQSSSTKFITVRFGNVLNSVGSVVPTFRKQIEVGGPITVTDEKMVRYFMTIPEASQLVLQAGAVGKSGNVLILEMGEPVKIVDLAKDMISLSGLNYPDDIDIQFTGLRPGEKMYEELFYSHEQSAEKIHEKIILGSGFAPSVMQINNEVQQLSTTLNDEPAQIADSLWSIVNRYVALDDSASSTTTDIPAAA